MAEYFDMEVDDVEEEEAYNDGCDVVEDDDDQCEDVVITPRTVREEEPEEITVTPALDLDGCDDLPEGNNTEEKTDKTDAGVDEAAPKPPPDDDDDDCILVDSDEEGGSSIKKPHKPIPLPKKTMTFTVKIFSRGQGENKTLVCGFDGCTHTCSDFQVMMDHTRDHFRKKLNKDPEMIVQHVKKTPVMDETTRQTNDCLELLRNTPLHNGSLQLGNRPPPPLKPSPQAASLIYGSQQRKPQHEEFKCPVKGCGLTFLSQLGLSIHARAHDDKTKTDNTTPKTTAQSLRSLKPTGIQFTCTSRNCNQKFNTYIDLHRHREEQHKRVVGNGAPGAQPIRGSLQPATKVTTFSPTINRPITNRIRPAVINKTNSKKSFVSAYMSSVTNGEEGSATKSKNKKDSKEASTPTRQYKLRERSASVSYDFDEQIENILKAQETLGDGQKVTRKMVKDMLEQPVGGCDTEETRYFLCPVEGCGVAIAEGDISSHLMIHTIQPTFSCSKMRCGMQFDTLEDYQEHKKIHKRPLKYPCPVPGCRKSFKTKSAFNIHRKEQHKNKLYRCVFTKCGRFFRSLNHLKTHVKMKHTLVFGSDPTPCTADGCEMKFGSILELHKHVMNEHIVVKSAVDESSEDEDWRLPDTMDMMLQVGVEVNEGCVDLSQIPDYIDMVGSLWGDNESGVDAGPDDSHLHEHVEEVEEVDEKQSDSNKVEVIQEENQPNREEKSGSDEEFVLSEASSGEQEDSSDEDFEEELKRKKRRKSIKKQNVKRSRVSTGSIVQQVSDEKSCDQVNQSDSGKSSDVQSTNNQSQNGSAESSRSSVDGDQSDNSVFKCSYKDCVETFHSSSQLKDHSSSHE